MKNIFSKIVVIALLFLAPSAVSAATQYIVNKSGYQQVIITDPSTGYVTGSAAAPLNADSGPTNAVAVNLSGDTTYSPILRGVWVGGGGNVVVDMATTGTQITFYNVAGGYLQGHFSKIYSTANGTTATNLVAVW